MDNDALQQVIQNIQAQLAQVSQQFAGHYHNGFDSNQVSYLDLAQKKLYVHHTIQGAAAATATNYGTFFISPVAGTVTRILEAHQVIGSDAGTVSLNIEKLTSGVAPDSGSVILATAFSLKATANTVQTGVFPIGASDARTLAAGDRLCMKDAGVLTAVSNVTVMVEVTF